MAKRDIQPRRGPTRKQIALSRKEQQQLRWIYIGLAVLGVLVVVVLGVGLWQTYVLEPQAPIATVDGVEITTRDYQTRVKYERYMLDLALQQVAVQRQQLLQSDPQLAELLVGQYDQQAQQLQEQRYLVDQDTLDLMIEDKLIEAEAARRGIVVSEEEIDETINQLIARQLGGLTQAAASETVTARVEASATAALWTPTPTFTPSPTLTPTAEITQPTATPMNTPTPAPTPTLYVVDSSSLGTQYTAWLEALAENAGIDEATYRQIVRTFILRDKLQEVLGAEVPEVAEQAHARHILVETEEEAQEVITRLQAGEDFADLAEELSKDTGSSMSGGDLGFVPQGRFVAPIDEAVFTLPVGQISDPIESEFGWHVIEVLEREERELSPADYQLSQRLAYNDWLEKARSQAIIEDFWTVDKVPEDPLYEQQSQIPQVPAEP